MNVVTLGVEESKQLSSQLSVGHGLPEEGFLLSQLLRTEVLCLPSHPLVVVQHSQESSVGGSGEQSLLVQVLEQAGNTKTKGIHTSRSRRRGANEREMKLCPHCLEERSNSKLV